MNDLTAIGIFIACLIATLGLVRACEWLGPRAQREQAPAGPGSAAGRRPAGESH